MAMDAQKTSIAQRCLSGAETNEMTFPEIVGVLMDAGFEGYTVDFRRSTAAYYLRSGNAIELPIHRSEVAVMDSFDPLSLKDAIREAQTLAPGYTYNGFCDKAKRAGCAGYMVSFSGRRALYFGRTAETHVEHFPDAQ